MRNETLEAALSYGALGWRVFPCKPNDKVPKTGCKWKEAATSNPDELGRLFRGSGQNIAWAVAEGYMVVDIDCKGGKDGFATLAALERQFGQLPACPVQKSPSGGEHLVFLLPDRTTVKNGVNSLGIGLDVRADGGYILVEPSSIDGKAYQWADNSPREGGYIPLAPTWLIELANRKPGATLPKGAAHTGTGMAISEGGRNAALASLGGIMRRQGMAFETILAALLSENLGRCRPPLDESEVETIARSVSGYEPGADIALSRPVSDWQGAIGEAEGNSDEMVRVARAIAGDEGLTRTGRENLLKLAARVAGVSLRVLKSDIALSATDPASALPSISIAKGDFAATVDAAARLLPSITNLFQRGGELVEVVPLADRADVLMQPISPPRLAYLLAQAARWSYGEGGDGSPPGEAIAALLSQAYWLGVKPLAGLLRQPVVNEVGRLIGSGYDAETMRLGIFNEENFPEYPGTPGEALAELQGLLSESFFDTPADKSAALAAILTAAIRPALAAAPAFMVQAPELASGKTYLAQLIGEFAGGASVRRWPRDETESSKVIFATLLEGRPCVLFDNLVRDWNGESMAAVLTSPTYSDRTLGSHKTVEVSTSSLFLATGNNVKPVHDLVRRVVPIRLDSRMETPACKQYFGDPLHEVQSRRGYWVMVALRVIQGWHEAGKPHKEIPIVGSFGQWGEMVRQPLVWLGLPDPATALLEGLGQGDDKELLHRFLSNWYEAFGDVQITLKDILRGTTGPKDDTPESAVRDVMEEVALERGEINARRVGMWMNTNSKRVVGGYRLEIGEKTRYGRPWYVTRV
jgi:hypothetical protein